MKNVKFIIALFAAILFSIPTFAQHHERHGHGMKHMMSELNLTDAQKEQMKTLRETYRQKADVLRSQDSDHTAKREQLKQLRQEQEAAFKNILTNEQIAKMDAMKADRKAKKEAFKGKKNVDKEGMKEEMKAYKKENIAPVLLQQRKKLESAISSADKTQINELRATLKAAKQEMKAKKDAHREKGERPTKAEREQWKAMKDKYRPQHEKAKTLVDKYDAQITALFAEIESERNEWKEDMKDIKDKYFGDLAEEFGEHPRGKKWGKKRGGDRDARKGKRHHHKGEEAHHRGRHHKGDKEKIAFLLMDVEKSEKRAARKGRKANAIKVFPNPSATTNSLEYSVKEAGNVKIELHDKSGNIVKEIISEYKTPGTYTETIDLSELRDIVYFYVITDKNGVRSKKFMVKR